MKQDLRVQKTEEAIRKAFMELLQEERLEKITVRALAERARINKTTFYAHYATIYDFYNALAQESLDSVLQKINQVTLLFREPEQFVRDLYADLRGYVGVQAHISAANMQAFAQRLRDVTWDEWTRQGVPEEQVETLHLVLMFVINGIFGLQTERPEQAEKQLDALCRFVRGGVETLRQDLQLELR